MELTGYSTDFVIDTSFPDLARAFISAQAGRWPGLYLCGEPATADSAEGWQPEGDSESEYPDILTFSSGTAMEAFWEDHGYALNPDGEGPFSLMYLRRRSPLRAGLGEDSVHARPDITAAVQGAQLLLSDFYLVSLVTPGDPQTDAFSASVLDDLLQCFAGV